MVLFSNPMDNTNLERCCTCLAQDHTLIPLSTLSILHLSDIFMAWASVQIRPNDEFSQFACTECVTLAEKAYIFKRLQEKPISKPALFIPGENLETIVRPQTPVEIKCETFEHQVENDLEMLDIKSVEILEEIKPKTFSCINCVAIFTDVDELCRHNLVHGIEPKILSVKELVMYSCQECFIDIETPDAFIEHCFTLHESSIENLRYLCKLCATELPNLCQLGAHVNRMHKKKSVPLVKGPRRLSRTSTWPQTCGYCQLRLKSLHEKIAHDNEAHSDLKKFSCDKCGKTFLHKKQLLQHARYHEDAKKYMCQYCGKIFKMSFNLIAPYDGFSQYVCSECVASAEKAYLFRKQCEYSDKFLKEFRGPFISSPNLPIEKVECQVNNNPEITETRSVEIHNEANNETDIKSIEIDEVKIESFTCKYCSTIFVDEEKFLRHELAHTMEPKNLKVKEYVIYVCRTCPVDFKTSASFLEHCHKLHENSIEGLYYRCKLCAGDFAHLTQLTKHVSKRHKRSETFICQYCGKCYRDLTQLQGHIRVHTGEKPFNCDKCNACFSTQSILRNHKHCHASEKRYECRKCHKKFTRYDSVKKHMLVHKVEPPKHSCRLCQKEFKRIKTLRSHLTTHSNEFSFACKVCKKEFNRMGNLRTHMITHTGEKPYICTICKKAFGYAHCLRAHTAKYHSHSNNNK